MNLSLALLCLAQLDPRTAVARWREALALDLAGEVLAEGPALVGPGGALEHDGEALALVARAQLETHPEDPQLAWATLARARPAPETAAAVELEKVRFLIERDELARALIASLPSPDAAEPRFPERAESWLYAGRAWARSGQLARAAPFLERFVALAPRDAQAVSALHALAQAALARQDGRAARELVARAEELARWHALWKVRVLQVRERPAEPLPRLGLAQLWLQAGEPARAGAVLRELVALAPDFAAGWFHLGEAERMLGDMDAAAAAYTEALEREPEHVLALHNRGTIRRLAGSLDEARADFERVVAGPRAGEKAALASHYWLAVVLDQLGQPGPAQERYARYRKLGGTEPLPPRR